MANVEYYPVPKSEAELEKLLTEHVEIYSKFPPSKTDVNTLIPYIGRYFKKGDYYYRPYLLEYHSESYNREWYMKGERLQYNDYTYHNQFDILFLPTYDVEQEITVKEFEEVKNLIANKYSYYQSLDKYLPLMSENKLTRKETKLYFEKSKLNRTYFLFSWITSNAFRLEEVTVEEGKVVTNLTHQVTCDKTDGHYYPSYWLQFFPGTEINKHQLEFYKHSDNEKDNYFWFLEKSKFDKIKNMIANPLDFLK